MTVNSTFCAMILSMFERSSSFSLLYISFSLSCSFFCSTCWLYPIKASNILSIIFLPYLSTKTLQTLSSTFPFFLLAIIISALYLIDLTIFISSRYCLNWSIAIPILLFNSYFYIPKMFMISSGIISILSKMNVKDLGGVSLDKLCFILELISSI